MAGAMLVAVAAAIAGLGAGQDVALCGSLSRDLARCLMAAQEEAPKDAQQKAAEDAVMECSQYKNPSGEFMVGQPCRTAVGAINDRIVCMDRGTANETFQEAMLDCIGNATQDALAQSAKRRKESSRPAWPAQAFPQGAQRGMPGGGARGGMGGPPQQQGPSEMDNCMKDRAFQTCMRSDVAKAHFERGFREARAQRRQQQAPCAEEQRRLLEAGCPAQPLPDSLCPCKCQLVESLKLSCGFPEAPHSCPDICAAAAAHAAHAARRHPMMG